MRLYFLRDVRASFAPNGIFKQGGVYDISLNNIPTMLDNGFAIPESERPKQIITIKKPKKGRPKKK